MLRLVAMFSRGKFGRFQVIPSVNLPGARTERRDRAEADADARAEADADAAVG